MSAPLDPRTVEVRVSRFLNIFDTTPELVTGALGEILGTHQVIPWERTGEPPTDKKLDPRRAEIPLICGGIFKAGTSRKKENVECISLLMHDGDDLTPEDVADIEQRVRGAGAAVIIYSTWSHGAEGHGLCLRFVILLSRDVLPDEWLHLWRVTNGELLGGRADVYTKDASRMMFLPVAPEERAALVELRAIEGAPLDVEEWLAKAAPSNRRQLRVVSGDGHRQAAATRKLGRHDLLLLHGTKLAKGGADRSAIRQGLDSLNANLSEPKPASELDGIADWVADNVQPRQSQADHLVALATEHAELFHSPADEGYATIKNGATRETWRLTTKGFRRWLASVFYAKTGKAPGGQALADAVNTLGGIAQFKSPELPVHVRIAEYRGKIYLDLCDADWRVVEVTAIGWRVLKNSPVKFCRRGGTRALPLPVRDDRSLEDLLRPFINATDDGWRLIVAWVIGAFRPNRPFPILFLHGEHGAAKSTSVRVLRRLIDPNIADLRPEPQSPHDLVIAASNSWVVALDNLSHIPSWISDALCRLATGGGFGTRELYSDDEEKLFDAMRPVVVNGIDELATRADLLDRALLVELPVIPEVERRDEETLWGEFERQRPAILGALLDVVAGALRRVAEVRLGSQPRMADFARWVTAAEPTLGWPDGSFLVTYRANRASANDLAIEGSSVGAAIVAFVLGRSGQWEGSAGDLLQELNRTADEATRKSRSWPGSGRGLSAALKRIVPNLRAEGIEVGQLPRRARTRAWLVRRIEPASETASQSSLAPPTDFSREVQLDWTTELELDRRTGDSDAFDGHDEPDSCDGYTQPGTDPEDVAP